MSSYKSKPCNKGCGISIHFDESQRSKSGKAIPLEDDGQPHNCPNALPYTGQGPSATARVSNPIERIVEHENHRDQRIREAQEQRKAEHDQFIREMQDLRVDIRKLIGTIEVLITALDKKEWTVNSG
jgi:hypothetical protein